MARIARLLPALVPVLLLAAPAAAQEVSSDPLPLFRAVCIDGSARLTKRIAAAADFATLAPPAKRAIGATTVATRAEAEKLAAPAPASVTNTIYRINDSQVYLLVPGSVPPVAAIGESCIVLWYATSDQDYSAARALIVPDEGVIPLHARPTASPVGAAVATSLSGEFRLTAAAYGGWIALSSKPETKSQAGAQ